MGAIGARILILFFVIACADVVQPVTEVLVTTEGSGATQTMSLSSPATTLLADETGVFLARQNTIVHVSLEGTERALALYGADGRALVNPTLIAPREGAGPFVLAASGLFYAEQGILLASGLSAKLPKQIDSILETPEGVLYIAAADGLYRHQDGVLARVEFNADTSPIHMLSRVGSVLYFEMNQRVFAYNTIDQSVRSSVLLSEKVTHVSAAKDSVYVTTANSVLRVQQEANRLTLIRTASPLIPRLTTSAAKGAFWVSDTGVSFVANQEATVVTLDAKVTLADVTHIATDSQGTLWMLAGTSLVNVVLGRPIRALGLRERQSVLGRFFLRVYPAAQSSLKSLTVKLEDHTETFENPPFDFGGRSATGEPAGFDSATLTSGEHAIEIDAAYIDGTHTTRAFNFSVNRVLNGTPTYATHIAPIYRTRCAKCHIAGAAAFDLDGAEKWKAKISQIVNSTQQKRMPIDMPLPSELIDVIVRWKDEGTPP
jgi:hypothetical protein